MCSKFESKHYKKNGYFYAINLDVLFNGVYREIPIAEVIEGTNHDINKGRTADNISILINFNSIVMIPLPHYNLLSFVGMGARSEYLAFQESKDGFF